MSTVDKIEFPESVVQRRTERGENRLVAWVRRVPEGWWPWLLVVSDALLIFVAFVVAYLLRYQLQLFRSVDPAWQLTFRDYLPLGLSLVAVVLIAFRFSRVYPYRAGRNVLEESWRIATAATAGVVVIIVLSLAIQQTLFSRLLFLYSALAITVLLSLSRIAIYLARQYLRAFDIGVRRVLLVGAGDIGRSVMRTVAARPDYGYRLVGFLDDNPAKRNTDIGRFKALGAVDSAREVIEQQQINVAIICLPWQTHRTIQRLLRECEQLGVQAYVVPDLFQVTKNQMTVADLNGIPLITTRDVSIQGWNLILKRVSDFVLAGFMALVALPIMAVIAVAVKLDSPGPVLYSQSRVGRNGKEFRCFKFRSMVDGAEQLQQQLDDLNESTGPLFKMRDDPRCTRVGRWLRRLSLDELPQMINVFRGEMSLIGPRPNLPSEVAHYQEWHKKRLSVSPGITGLWQVSGRSDLTFDEMVLLDIYYVENWSLGLDLSILLRSIPAVLGARGAY